MAMRKCRECNELISTDAKTCPRCGKPNPTRAPVTCSGLIVAFVLVSVVAWLIFKPNRTATPEPSPAPSVELNPAPDEAADVIARCGKPQGDYTKDAGGGQRLRHLTYKAANVELVYMMGGNEPSQLVAAFAANADKDAFPLPIEEANRRLVCAKGSLRLPI